MGFLYCGKKTRTKYTKFINIVELFPYRFELAMLSVSCCWIVQALSDDAKYCKKMEMT